jgi:hypothetical protein
MRIDAQGFRLMYGIGEMIRQIVLTDRDGQEFSACLARHLFGNFSLVIFGTIKSEGEGAHRPVMMPRRQTEHRA